MYLLLYNKLCEDRKSLVSFYRSSSGLHAHHIIPKHQGGDDSVENLTFLTVKEHIIAHFMLWKIYKNPNDLRAMKMLGAKLTVTQRKIIGEFCRDNRLGFHGANDNDRKRWRQKGLDKIKEQGYTLSKLSDEQRKQFGKIGGTVSIKSPNNPWSFWASKEGQLLRSSMGGKSNIGKWWIYYPPTNRMTRINPDKYPEYFDQGWIFGRRKKKFKVYGSLL